MSGELKDFIGSIIFRPENGSGKISGVYIEKGEIGHQSQYNQKYDINLDSGGLRKEGDELRYFETKEQAFDEFIVNLQKLIPNDAKKVVVRNIILVQEPSDEGNKFCVVARLHFI